MNESRTNARARMAHAGARQLGVELILSFAPKANVLILPPDRIRVTAEGRTEIYAVEPQVMPDGSIVPGRGEPTWIAPDATTEVVPDGATLGTDKLDLVVNLVATAVGGMVGPDGRVMGRRRHLRELFREDADHFLATLGAGPQPS